MKHKRLLLILLTVLLLAAICSAVFAAPAVRGISKPSGMSVTSQTDYTITTGITETQFKLSNGGQPLTGFMATISPSAKVKVKASYPNYYTKGSTAESRAANYVNIPLANLQTTKQAAAYETATGEKVYHAINGSFFDSNNVARGHLIMEGHVFQPGFHTVQEPYFAVLKNGTYAIRDYTEPYYDVEEAIAARHWLVKDGKNVVTYGESADHTSLVHVLHPRTAIGLKADGTIVTMIIDGRRDGYSVGVTLPELADIMIAAGCVSAVNLDGGGSSTFASVRNSTGTLTIRNQVTDATGERPVTSCLLFVAAEGECKHTYGTSYTINNDGTHSQACTACSKLMTMEHRYTSGKCVCGDKQATVDSLYFNFSNTNYDRERYTNPAYGYFNFDVPTLEIWRRGFWATKAVSTTENKVNGFTVDNATGTLNVTVADGQPYGDANNNGPWVTTTMAYRQYPNANDQVTLPLNYDPSKAEVVQLRFKVTGCKQTKTTDPRVVVVYDHTTGATTARGDYTMVQSYALQDGVYQTLTFPVSDTFKNADAIRSFGFRFWDLQSTNSGTVSIDYIYVGPKAGLEENRGLYFGFNNTAADQAHYDDRAYNNTNFDLASNWAKYSHVGSLSISGGAMKFTAGSAHTGYGYVNAGATINSKPILYTPSAEDYVQVRFKVDNAVTTDTYEAYKGVGRFVLYFSDDSMGNRDNYLGYNFNATDVVGKGYITLRLKVSDMIQNGASWTSLSQITSISPCFNWLKSAEGKTASFTIDYLYVGPVRDGLFFDFGTSKQEQEGYNSFEYGYNPFGTANWRSVSASTTNIKYDASTSSISYQLAEGSTNAYIQTTDSTNTLTATPLHYTPKSGDHVQVRIKLENLKAASTSSAYMRLYYTMNDGTSGVNAEKFTTIMNLKTEHYNGQYFTVTVPLDTSFTSAKSINAVRLQIGNLANADGATGTVYVDFIAIGQKSALPVQDRLFFNFTNSAEDKARYNTKQYGYLNFDTKTYWYQRKDNMNPVSIASGKMTTTLVATPPNGEHYIQTSGSSTKASMPLIYVPQSGDYFQMKLKIDGAALYDSSKNLELGVYYYNGSNWFRETAVYHKSVLGNGYFTVTIPLSTTFTSSKEIPAIRAWFNNITHASGKTATFTIDYIAVGQASSLRNAPYTVKFVGADGKVLDTQTVAKGDTVYYRGATPTKASDATNHYTFKGWDKTLTGISSNLTVTAQFTATAHAYSYAKVDATNHKATCSCGYSKTAAHTWDAGTVTTAPTFTAKGVKTYTCTGCKATKTESLAVRSNYLLFDFDNSTAAQSRYNNYTYGFVNFDTKDHWRIQGRTASVSISGGALLLSDTPDSTSDYHGATVTKSGSHDVPLNFDPSQAEYFQIRFKLENLSAVEGQTPYLKLNFWVEGNSSTVTASTKNANIPTQAFTDGGYCVLTVAVDDSIRALGNITAVRPYVRYLQSTAGKTGVLSVDYMYLGPKANLPMQDALYFNFTNTSADQTRYATKTYNNKNYDLADTWRGRTSGYTNGTATVDAGALTVKPGESSFTAIYADTGASGLSYNADQAEFFQIRFKMTGFSGTQGKASVHFYPKTDSAYADSLTNTPVIFDASYLSSGKYITLTGAIDQSIRDFDGEFERFIVHISGFTDPGNANGTLTIDYAYVGPKATLPTPAYTVKFVDGNGKVLSSRLVTKGESASYTGATPTKAYDSTNHYTFKAWDKALTNITADTTITATFTATAHAYSYAKVDATKHKASCTCGYSKSVAHTWNSGSVTTQPTCTAAGVKTFTCSACKQTKTETVAKLGHSYTTKVTAPTCTAQGYTTHTCSRCSDSYKDTYVAATGHSWNNGVITTEATCTTAGVKTFTCSACKQTKTESVAAKGHTEVVDKAVAATCTSAGKTEGKHCSVCNEVIVAQEEVAALGHTEVLDKAIAPTCTETGLSEGKHCETCGEVLVARGILDALGHAPQYADNGDKTHTITCKNCDFSEIEDCVFENGECICGAKEVLAPIYDEAVKFSHSLTLENDISINFIGLGSALIGYDSFYLECKVPVYNGNELVGYETVKIDPVYNGKNYECTLLGITAKMMNDEIEAVFRMTRDGQEYYSRTDVYSVAEYAYGKLDSTKATDTAELKAICANLLRYGSMAQVQFNYRTDALVDTAMTDAHKAFLTDLNTVEMKDYRKQLSDLNTVIVPWKSTTLELGNKVIMCLIANLANYTGDPSELTMRLSYTDAKGVTVTEERPLALYNPEALSYAVSYDGLRATEMRSVVSAAIYRNGERVSKTVEYSIESYGARSKDPAMQELCRAMLAYGDSANAFFSH